MNSLHNQPPSPPLRSILGAYLNIEDYDLDGLSEWCGKADFTIPRVREFKEQLLAAVKQPGLVTPQVYQSWTANRDFATQEELQEHLKEVWNACFPAEAIK